MTYSVAPARPLACGLERDDFGVRASRPLVPSLPYDLVAGNDHGSDDGIRVRLPRPRSASSSARSNGFGKSLHELPVGPRIILPAEDRAARDRPAPRPA